MNTAMTREDFINGKPFRYQGDNLKRVFHAQENLTWIMNGDKAYVCLYRVNEDHFIWLDFIFGQKVIGTTYFIELTKIEP